MVKDGRSVSGSGKTSVNGGDAPRKSSHEDAHTLELRLSVQRGRLASSLLFSVLATS